MELNIEIIKEFINLEELHSSKSNPRTYLSVYQGAVEEMLKKYLKQQKEIEKLKKENAFLKELFKKPEGFNSITRTGGNIE